MTGPELPPQQPNRAPINLGKADLPSPNPMQGEPLPAHEAMELLLLAKQGRDQLSRMKPGASQASAGLELELTLSDDKGQPLPVAPRVLSALEAAQKQSPGLVPGSATGEYAAFNIELNSAPILNLGPDFLRVMEQNLRAQMRQAAAVARQFGGHLASVGILPSIFAQHLGDAYVSQKQRYRDLEVALAGERERFPDPMNFYYKSATRGEFGVALDHQGLHIKGPRRKEIVEPLLDTAAKRMVRYNALDTSVQYHWGVRDQADYVRDHRISDLISAVMVGVCANSPLVLGELTGLKENRLFIYSTMLHPRRVILAQSWLAHPLGQIDDALSRGVILGARGSKVADQTMKPLIALQLLQGTTWPLNRTVVTADETTNTRVLRVEHRPIPSQPTLADTMGAAALFYGLMAGMPEYLKRLGVDLGEGTSPDLLDERLSFKNVINNVGRACVDGLQSTIVWFDRRKVEIQHLLEKELLPVAHAGLASLGVSSADRARYLGVIERRLAARLGSDQLGVTPGDIIRDRFFIGEEQILGPAENCNRISRWLSDIFEPPAGDDLRDMLSFHQEARGRVIR